MDLGTIAEIVLGAISLPVHNTCLIQHLHKTVSDSPRSLYTELLLNWTLIFYLVWSRKQSIHACHCYLSVCSEISTAETSSRVLAVLELLLVLFDLSAHSSVVVVVQECNKQHFVSVQPGCPVSASRVLPLPAHDLLSGTER